MITWKCLYKLSKEELAILQNDINNGISYNVVGWEDVYPTDNEILDYILLNDRANTKIVL